MAFKATPERRNVKTIIISTLTIATYLLICILQDLQTDSNAGKWESLSIRVGWVVLVSFLVAWRINTQFQIKRSRISTEIAVSVLFLGVLFYPLLSQFSYLNDSIRDVSQFISKDRHGLTEKIDTLLKLFPGTYEKYTTDRFKLPKSYIHFNALFKVNILGVSPNKKVALGKDGFYFEGWGAERVEKGIVESFDNIADYMGQIPFSLDELRQWKRALEERKYWLKERGIDYVFVLAPTKALVYPEYLPSNLQRVSKGTTRYDQLSHYLRTTSNIHFFDVLPALLKAKEERAYPLLFYKTDFHWNFYGAFIAYQAIMDEVRKIFPEYKLHHPEFSEFNLLIDKNWAHFRFIDMVGLPVSLYMNEHYITMIPKPGGRYDSARDLPPKGISDVYPPERPVKSDNGQVMNLRLILNPDAPIRSILLLGDSFLEKCVYFFSADAQRVLNYRTVVNFPSEIFLYEKPNIVIQEILNMFILREPPQNPPGFSASYRKGKFADSSGNVIAQRSKNDFIKRIEGDKRIVEIQLVDMPALRENETWFSKLTLVSQEPGNIDIRAYTADNREVVASKCEIMTGSNDVYFEFPAEKITRITFTEADDSKPLFTPMAFEVRSDQALPPAR
jgi:hypothetical protein